MNRKILLEDISDEDFIKEPVIDPREDFHDVEMCDWCGVRPVVYRDASYHLCEICEEQLWGD